MMSPKIASKLNGIERADSIAIDFHKWGQVPYDAGFVMVRDSRLHQDTFSFPAAYLSRETRGMAAGSPWPCDCLRKVRSNTEWFIGKVVQEIASKPDSLTTRCASYRIAPQLTGLRVVLR